MTPSVAIVGAGAIGAWLGRCVRPRRMAGVHDRAWRNAGGVALDGLAGCPGRHNSYQPAQGQVPPWSSGVQDFVILTVKAQMLCRRWRPRLARSLGPETVVISGTNGIPWWFLQDFGGPLANRALQSVDPTRSQEQTFPRSTQLGFRGACVGARRIAGQRAGGGRRPPHPRCAGRLAIRRDSIPWCKRLRKGGIDAQASQQHSARGVDQALGQHDREPLECVDALRNREDAGGRAMCANCAFA